MPLAISTQLGAPDLDGTDQDSDHVGVAISVQFQNGQYTVTGAAFSGSLNTTTSGQITDVPVSDFNFSGNVITYQLSGDPSGSTFGGQVIGWDATDQTYLVDQYLGFTPITTGDPNTNTFVSNGLSTNHYELISLSTTSDLTTNGPSSSHPFVFATACYCAGSPILTARGEVAVERLRPGDQVITLARGGALRPVIWVGHSCIDTARHPDPDAVAPVRIRAGAIAAATPLRDLVVSPEHAIGLLDDAGHRVLVPALCLVNGATIVREPAGGTVRYVHVELARHDILLAAGLAAESYLDTGNRSAFDNAGAHRQLYPSFLPRNWDSDGCAPLLLGAAAAPLHARLLRRAELLGYRVTDDPALTVLADGVALAPLSHAGGRYVFRMPVGIRSVRLNSRVAAASDFDPAAPDRRRGGVPVARLLQDGIELPLDGPAPRDGFLAPERRGDDCWRWTDGDACVALRTDACVAPRAAGESLLEVQLHEGWHRYWRSPEDAVRRQQRRA
jgi:hypothetical protein